MLISLLLLILIHLKNVNGKKKMSKDSKVVDTYRCVSLHKMGSIESGKLDPEC